MRESARGEQEKGGRHPLVPFFPPLVAMLGLVDFCTPSLSFVPFSVPFSFEKMGRRGPTLTAGCRMVFGRLLDGNSCLDEEN